MSRYDGLNSLKEIYEHNCNKPSDIHEHCPVLYQLAKECDSVTEFGTRWCVSTSALLYAQPKKMSCYDISKRGEVGVISKFTGDTQFEFKKEDTREVEIEETDLLFIDTWHAYEQLIIELTKHGNKARKYIVLHDTETYAMRGDTLKGTRPGVGGLRRAIKEFLEANPNWTEWKHYKNNNGLTILKRTPE